MPSNLLEAIASFVEHFSHPPTIQVRSPGRVNLLGEHVDYNDGLVLPAAIDRAVTIAAAPSGDNWVSLVALDLDESVIFDLDDLDARQDINGAPLPGWACYPAGVAWALRQAGLTVSGLQAVYNSDVPIGAGLSSSAAVEVGFAVAWRTLGGWPLPPLALAQLCQRAENLYVGMRCGLMDQFACACGVAGHALYFDIRSLEWQPAPLPPGTAIIIADSGMRRSLTTSAYNDRRAACEQAVEDLQHFLPKMHSLREISPQEFAAYSDCLEPVVRRRAEHVVKEIARVETALRALQRQDERVFGALMYSCHASLRDLYEVSTPELDTLVQLTRTLPGCLGARLTGAGFGGCTVNLVRQSDAPAFIDRLAAGYFQATGRQATVYLCQASQGAALLAPV
jgi:galactokinase